MNNTMYYNNEMVKVIRTFGYGGNRYAEVSRKNGETFIASMKELTERPEMHFVTQPAMEVPDIITEVKKIEFDEDNKIIYGSEGLTINLGTGTINYSGEVPTSTFDAIEPERLVLVYATNIKTDEVLALGTRKELNMSGDVKKLKLDPEAIERCLNGEQKQHKGYTFEIK